jgi:predicted SAM-dependent methyltransferase
MRVTKLNLGCGHKRIQDAVNADVAISVGPDVVCDLNKRPWPFGDDQFLEVFAYDVIEHCDDVVLTMEEIHRVCGDGAVLRITVPHFSCANAFTDPTHRHQFGWSSFHYFTREHKLSFYSSATFRRRISQIIFHPTFVNKVVRRLANGHPEAYERRWAWLFPAWFLYFELEVIKRPV